MIEELKNDKELWGLFARQETYNPTFLDKHGRFLNYMSVNREILTPGVSEFLADHAWFRNGICHPVQPYDLPKTNRSKSSRSH